MLIEQPAHHAPRKVVQWCCRRKFSRPAENQGSVQITNIRLWPGSSSEVKDNGGKGSEDPKVHQGTVNLARGEDAAGADEAPDDGGVEEHAAIGAGEVGDLFRGADILDGAEGPFHDGDLDEAGPGCCDGLGGAGTGKLVYVFFGR